MAKGKIYKVTYTKNRKKEEAFFSSRHSANRHSDDVKRSTNIKKVDITEVSLDVPNHECKFDADLARNNMFMATLIKLT